MGVRETINETKGLGIGVAAAAMIIAIGLLAYQLNGGGGQGAAKQAFFTDDDGKTFFKDDIEKLSPFDHNGKKAYRADVLRCTDGHEFVGLIYRHTDGGRKELESYQKDMKAKDVDGQVRANIEMRGMEVHRPGAAEKGWMPNDELQMERLRAAAKCPLGKPGDLVNP
jgi:hypothetical protein